MPAEVVVKSDSKSLFGHFKDYKYVENIKSLFEIGSELSRGAYSTDYLTVRKSTGQNVIIKVIKKGVLEKNKACQTVVLNEL